jgi:hypothetical protein
LNLLLTAEGSIAITTFTVSLIVWSVSRSLIWEAILTKLAPAEVFEAAIAADPILLTRLELALQEGDEQFLAAIDDFGGRRSNSNGLLT